MKLEIISKQEFDNIISQLLLRIEKIELRETQDQKWLSTNEAAEYLGCSYKTIINYKNEGILSYGRLAGKLFFKKEEIDKLLKKDDN